MTPTTERLYNLLPAIYRQRDMAHGEPLRALLAVVEQELQTLEADIASLYDNWFVETCAEWVVPYIGDLLGIRGLSDEKHLVFSQRSRVANTTGYRRRKGVAAVLEHVVQDATGWPARVVEFFELVGISQHVQHVRPGSGGIASLRDNVGLERMGGPFDTTARRPDVRRIASNRGKHNTPNVGLFVWRLQSYPVANLAAPVGACRYRFDPLGYDVRLFNRPQTQTDPTQVADAVNLPILLTRTAFDADLRAYQARYQKVPPDQWPAESDYYGPARALNIIMDGKPVTPIEIMSADLGDWEHWNDSFLPKGKTIAVDVQLGRLACASASPPDSIAVAYNYGFSADIGGGPYNRLQALATPDADTWFAVVGQRGDATADQAAGEPRRFDTLQPALEAWSSSGRKGIVQILDSNVYDLPALELRAQGWLVIQAADGVRPSLRSGPVLNVSGRGADAALIFNGVRIDGAIEISGSLRLSLAHCTAPGGVRAAADLKDLRLAIGQSIVGPLRLPAGNAGIAVWDSIIDGRSAKVAADDDEGTRARAAEQGDAGDNRAAYAIAGIQAANQPGPSATIERTTIFGLVLVEELILASEVIFTDPVSVERRQTGGMRFCYAPDGSATPQRYRCQPDLALTDREDLANRERTKRRLAPSFTSRAYGDPGYAQLSQGCAEEIRAGAEDGSEIGAFHLLHQPQRQANLRAALDEYLAIGLEAGIYYVT